jgi:hypothetical protein
LARADLLAVELSSRALALGPHRDAAAIGRALVAPLDSPVVKPLWRRSRERPMRMVIQL